MLKFASQHPLIVAFGGLFGLASVVAYWPLFVALALIAGMAGAMYLASTMYDRDSLERAHHRRTLMAHADYEHHMHTAGHPIGVYGQWPPAI